MLPGKVRFLPNTSDDFASTLKSRIDAYFQEKGISKKANLEMVIKSVLYLTAFFVTYGLIVLGGFAPLISLVMAMFLGFLVAGIGFNVSHDAIHGAYSDKKWVNSIMGHTFSLMGANVFNWKIAHNIIHHSYTNIPEADGDLHSVKWLKFFKEKQGMGMHRYQNWYALALYSLTSLVWVFSKDYVHISRKKHLLYEKTPPPLKEYLWLFSSKAAYYFAFIFLPMIVMPGPWWYVIIGFIAMHLVAGFTLAVTFQLGHLVEGTGFHSLKDNLTVPENWNVHQLRSSANFATDKIWPTWVFGGLNFQIEHHLFPKICHVHYKNLAPIVEKTAEEYGLPYNNYDTFLSALRSHLRYLKTTGAQNI